MNNGNKIYYPRKMRVGWCVAHEFVTADAKVERYGARYKTYQEAYRAAEKLNSDQSPVDGHNKQTE